MITDGLIACINALKTQNYGSNRSRVNVLGLPTHRWCV